MSTVDDAAAPSPQRSSRAWWFVALGLGIVGLTAVSLLWLGGDDDGSGSSTDPPTTAITDRTTTGASVVPPTSAPGSSTTTTTTPPTTTTTTATTTTTTTEPTPASPTEPGGPVWSAASPYAPDGEVLMTRVDRADGLSAYDGEFGDGVSMIRCVAVAADGDTAWQEWCGASGQAARFVAVHDDVPWLVEVGGTPGDVSLIEQPADWTLPSNGCTDPLVELATVALAGESATSPAVVTSIVCVPGEAFVGYGSVFLQSGPVDGGGALIAERDDGWLSYGGGTSVGCDDLVDGVDRCDLFGVEYELFEALVPIPPSVTIGATDAVTGVDDRTVEVREWVGDRTDPTAVDSVVVDRLFDPSAEVPATVRRAVDSGSGVVDLLVVQIPQLDDSIETETWAVWIGALDENAGFLRAWSWVTCVRGVTDDGLCI